MLKFFKKELNQQIDEERKEVLRWQIKKLEEVLGLLALDKDKPEDNDKDNHNEKEQGLPWWGVLLLVLLVIEVLAGVIVGII